MGSMKFDSDVRLRVNAKRRRDTFDSSCSSTMEGNGIGLEG